MRPTHSSRRAPARRLRTTAASLGLAALLALFVPHASAAEPDRTYSVSQLKAAGDAVLRADIAGTAWSVDEDAGRVEVLADERVTDAGLAALRKEAGRLAGALTVERVEGTFSTRMMGGDGIYRDDSHMRCSVGFNVRSATTYYFVTAGHCTRDNRPTPPFPIWFGAPGFVGTTVDSVFPVSDFGLVEHSPQAVHPGVVNLHNGQSQQITAVGGAVVGQGVCRSGAATGLHCGTVTGVNTAVNFGGGDIVFGLYSTDICSQSGDSGGPLFSGDRGIGIVSGGSGNCQAGGITFAQPLRDVLAHYQLTLN
ncbi:S1 family peptidase [Streptomyces sodiiphilus]|uniref:S1 family peptidase n=1 Tax=Streptomyces sodiiphilus TaxID=226217 RepID=A0ABN2P5U8_9ACTN